MADTLREYFNKINPNSGMDALGSIRLGNLLRALPTYKNNVTAFTAAGTKPQLSTLSSIVLPDNAKAAVIHRATAKTGTTTGEYAPQAYGTTPTTGQIAVAPNGDIAILGSDAPTNMDLFYVPMKGTVVEYTGVPATGVLTLPTPWQGKAIYLVYAEILAGSTLGQSIILVPSGSLPATTKACLKTDRTAVLFNNATDAPTLVKVRVLIQRETDVDALLEATSSFT